MAQRKTTTIVDKLHDEILQNHLLKGNDKIVVAVSGGPDSMFLLYALIKMNIEKKLNLTINVAHVNHMIRKEAIQDENLVREYAQKNNCIFHLLKEDVKSIAKQDKLTIEECGRKIRYEFFEQVRKTSHSEKIFVAHNMDDNAETILMNIIRGCGIQGLCGMSIISSNIARPMLKIEKKDIVEYLDKNKIEYAIDKTNYENDYTRNKIRNVILKDMKECNPNVIEALNKMALVARQNVEIVDVCTSNELKGLVLSSTSKQILVSKSKLIALPYSVKCEVVRKLIEQLMGNLNNVQLIHIQDIVKLINTGNTKKQYILGNKFTVIMQKNEVLFIKKVKL